MEATSCLTYMHMYVGLRCSVTRPGPCVFRAWLSLRKHAYTNIYKISTPKTENFQIKTSDSFHISAQNIDCVYSLEPPRRGGSYEYPQSMFLSRNKKNNVYPCEPQFYCIKVGFKGVNIIQARFRDATQTTPCAFIENIWVQLFKANDIIS